MAMKKDSVPQKVLDKMVEMADNRWKNLSGSSCKIDMRTVKVTDAGIRTLVSATVNCYKPVSLDKMEKFDSDDYTCSLKKQGKGYKIMDCW